MILYRFVFWDVPNPRPWISEAAFDYPANGVEVHCHDGAVVATVTATDLGMAIGKMETAYKALGSPRLFAGLLPTHVRPLDTRDPPYDGPLAPCLKGSSRPA